MPLLLSELNIHTGIITNVSFGINESSSSNSAPSLRENTGEQTAKLDLYILNFSSYHFPFAES